MTPLPPTTLDDKQNSSYLVPPIVHWIILHLVLPRTWYTSMPLPSLSVFLLSSLSIQPLPAFELLLCSHVVTATTANDAATTAIDELPSSAPFLLSPFVLVLLYLLLLLPANRVILYLHPSVSIQALPPFDFFFCSHFFAANAAPTAPTTAAADDDDEYVDVEYHFAVHCSFFIGFRNQLLLYQLVPYMYLILLS